MAENKPSPFPPALKKRRATYCSRIYRSTAELSHVFRAARRRQSAAAHTAPYLSGPHGASRAETLLGCHFAASRGPPRTPGPGSSHPLHRLPALTALPRRPKRGQPRTSLPPRERPQPSAVAAVPPGPGGGRHAARPPPRAMTQTGAIPRPSPRPGTAPASVRRPLPRPSPRPPPPARQPQRSEPRGRRASRLLTKTYQPPPRPAQRRPGRAWPPPAPAPPAAAGPPPSLRASPGPCPPRLTSLGTSWFSSLGTMAGGAALGPQQAEPSVAAVVSSGRRRDAAGSSSFATAPADEGSHPSASANQWENGRRPHSRETWKARPQPPAARAGRGGGLDVVVASVHPRWRADFTQPLTEPGSRPVAGHNLPRKLKGRACRELPLRSETSQSSLSVRATAGNIVREEAASVRFSALLASGLLFIALPSLPARAGRA